MIILRHTDDVPARYRGGIVAIGNFDGVHRGHRAIIATAAALARAEDRPFGILTFEPHPRAAFQPDLAPFRLTPFRVKARLVEELGADFMFVQAFDLAYAQTTSDAFIQHTLLEALDVRHIVIGHDYAFGRGRTGTPDSLRRAGAAHGFGVTELAAVIGPAGTAFSSTGARDAIREGRCADAHAILGRDWSVEGRVEHGEARGRGIGFPTANVHLTDSLRPRAGVYAVRATIDDDPRVYPGVANCGTRPTFDGKGTVLEVHLFDLQENLYDRHLRVAFIHFLRDERKFDGIAALTRQIESDASTARRILAEPAQTASV
ncbi:bifunctional riboflavin kinase/FAD synthetase [Oleispirillum naphthae]|uniref:bifunctional riboflavin kinase/FAD synthetase n=1 Tax=Oleispirillum naphthae TaxID=2838853 RepID=UPI003082319D